MSNLQFVAEIQSFSDAVAFLGGRESRKLAHNTWVEDLGEGEIGVRYHKTYIVVYREGSAALSNGGWNTVTTSNRIHRLIPAKYRVGIRKGLMTLTRPDESEEIFRFFDTLNIAI